MSAKLFVRPLVFCLILFVADRPVFSQIDDNPEYHSWQTTVFAAPLVIPDDPIERAISTIRIRTENLAAEGGSGTIQIDRRKYEINEFGDATPANGTKVDDYKVRFERNAEVNPRNPRRAVYKIVFDDNMLVDRLCLVTYSNNAKRSRLILLVT